MSGYKKDFFSPTDNCGFPPEECDATCLNENCGESFIVAICGIECPKCGNKNPEKISIKKGKDGNPLSFSNISKHRREKK